MGSSTIASNPNPASKSESVSIQHPNSVFDASSAALSTAAAVAAITSNCPIQRAPPIVATVPPANVQSRLQQNALLSAKGVMNQVFPHQPQSNSVNVPQHHLIMNLVHPQVYPMPNKYTTPSVFTNLKLRRGKWTPEEERFANALIKEFEKGTIHDCENGCTLRAFLSRKLHCAPMRISKKYAGKSIGKHVFLSRNSATTHSHQAMQLNIHKLRQLEFQFHVSLFQEGSPGMEHDNAKLGQALFPGNDLNQMVTGFPMAFRPNLLTNEMGNTMNAMNTPNQCHGLPNQPAVFQWPVAAVPQPDPGHLSTWQNSSMLQRSLFTALHQPPGTPSLSQRTPVSTHVNGGNERQPFPASVQPSSFTMSGEKDCSTAPDNGSKLGSSVRSNPSANTQRPTHITYNGIEEINHSIIRGSQLLDDGKQTLLHSIAEKNQLNHLSPNLNRISNEVRGSSKIESDANERTEGKESYVDLSSSRNEVSQNDSNVTCGSNYLTVVNTLVNDTTDVMDDGYSTESCDLTADAYALFAQQSAMAVSKHSAYCMNDTNISISEAELSALYTESVNPKSIKFATDNVGECISMNSPNELQRDEKSAAFNATNLQIHLREAEEKARVDQTSVNNRHTTCDSTKHNSINIDDDGRHANLISGSERSSDMSADGAEGSTSVSCSGSGSDNASEDSGSYDINTSGERQKIKSLHEHEGNYNVDHDMDKIGQNKRQKLAVMVMENREQ